MHRALSWPIIVSAWMLAAVMPLAGQVTEVAMRGPRFLVATSPSSAPVPLDVRQVAVFRQRVSLDLTDASLEQALAELTRQSGLRFMYSKNVLTIGSRVQLQAKRITVAAALMELLVDAGVDVVLTRNGQAMLVRQDSARPAVIQGGTVTGRVTDAKSGQPVMNAEVLLEKTRWRTTSDTAGRYRLAEIDTGTYILIVRQIGYGKRRQRVVVHGEREDTVNLTLEPLTTKLGELITTATGRQRRRDIGNAITTIHADSVLRTAPIRNLTDLLEHRVPGLTVQHTSGAPGDPSKLRLRGLGSILRSNDPVVIVDGVRVYAVQSAARSGNLTNLDPTIDPATGGDGPLGLKDGHANPVDVPAPSPLDQIDPNIIDKIEVFKGPSAATLYGADAANGVIVITTKRGRPGPTRWHASLSRGRTTTPGQWPTGYYSFCHAAYRDAKEFCTASKLVGPYVSDSLVSFQALNEPALTVLGHGQITGLSLTTSGGTQALLYSITGSYNDEIGLLTLPDFEIDRFRKTFNQEPPDWMVRPHHYENWNVTSNVTARLSPSADVTLSTSLARSEQRRTSLEQQLAPLMGTYVDTLTGTYYRPGTGGLAVTSAALSDYYVRQTASTITFTTGLSAQWRPLSWLSASGQAGLNVVPRDDHLLLPAGLVAAATTDSGYVVRGTGRSLGSTFIIQGTLQKPLGFGFVFRTNVGANLVSTSTSDLVSSAQGLQSGTGSLTGATHVYSSEQGSNTSVYGWYIEPGITGQRFALSTGLRLDGGNAYGVRLTRSGSGGGGFLRNLLSLPKLNGSWVISEEPWFPFNTVFSSFRLRGAYGQAQVQPGPTDRVRFYSGTTGQPTSQLLLDKLGNTQLRPERSTEFEGGFDADLLDSRLSVELTTYRKLQVDALQLVEVAPSVNGGGSQLINIGNIRNTGLELTVTPTLVRSPLLTWSAEIHYSRNNNILTKLGKGVAPNKTQGWVEGYPLGSRWAQPILGFADQNSDGVLESEEIQVGDSLMYMGRLAPAYTSSLFTNMMLFGGAVGVTAGFSYDAGQTQVNSTLATNWVLARAFVDTGSALGEQAAVIASISGRTDYGLMQEISVFRFSSLSVNYRAPVRVARLLRAQQLSVAIQGSNLGLHSNYRGKDPNVNAWSPGEAVVDTGQLPQPRTWQIRVDVDY